VSGFAAAVSRARSTGASSRRTPSTALSYARSPTPVRTFDLTGRVYRRLHRTIACRKGQVHSRGDGRRARPAPHRPRRRRRRFVAPALPRQPRPRRHRVVEAATVAAALAALDEHEVDVILLDLHLGSASGLDVLDAVEAADLPARVVLLSGSSDLPADVRGRAAASLGKPFTLEDLARVVADDASGRLRGA
jgi:CheY-like chemotaxis protein